LADLVGRDTPERAAYIRYLADCANIRGCRVDERDVLAFLCSRKQALQFGELQITYVIRLVKLGMGMQMMYWWLYWLHQWVGFWDATPDINELIMPLNIVTWIGVSWFLGYVVWIWGHPPVFYAYLVLIAFMIFLMKFATWYDPENGNWWTVWYM